MKKTARLILCAAALLALAIALARPPVAHAADPDAAWREALRVIVTTNGLVTATDTNVSTTASNHAPAYKGQILFGGAGAGTSAVWIAEGTTTNDWVRLAP